MPRLALASVSVAAVFGFLGGLASHTLFSPVGVRAQDALEVVKARAFFLVDKDGNERSGWGLTKDGEPVLFLRAAQGQRRLVLESSEVSATDDDGKTRMMLMVGPDGGSMLSFLRETGDRSMSFSSKPDHGTTMEVFDTQRRLRLAFTVNPFGTSAFHINDKNGRLRLRLASELDGSASMTFKDEDDKVVRRLP
jgi:hypothetical protein